MALTARQKHNLIKGVVCSIALLIALGGLRVVLQWVDGQWPDKGLSLAFVLGMPILFLVAFAIDRKDGGKVKDFWGDPVTDVPYDIDIRPAAQVKKERLWIVFSGFVMGGLWLYSAYNLFH